MHHLTRVHADLPHDGGFQRLDNHVRYLRHDLAGHRDHPVNRVEPHDADGRQDRRGDDPDREPAADRNPVGDNGRGRRLELKQRLAAFDGD
jgi:hypothetical protein